MIVLVNREAVHAPVNSKTLRDGYSEASATLAVQPNLVVLVVPIFTLYVLFDLVLIHILLVHFVVALRLLARTFNAHVVALGFFFLKIVLLLLSL